MNIKTAMIVRAARGPIMLITVGALFAADQCGALRFGSSWPLLIIVYGLMKLVERLLWPRYVPPRFPAPPFTAPPFGASQPPYGPPPPPSSPPFGGAPR